MANNHKKSRNDEKGNVRKLIRSPNPIEPEKAEILIHAADGLFRENTPAWVTLTVRQQETVITGTRF